MKEQYSLRAKGGAHADNPSIQKGKQKNHPSRRLNLHTVFQAGQDNIRGLTSKDKMGLES